jgi:glycosyltransferase involved in cell wall biosynthesis
MCVSNFAASCITNFEPKTNCQVISNVVDTNLFYNNNNSSKTHSPFIFLHASMLSAEKNIMWLLQTVAALKKQHSNVILQLIGPATLEIQNEIKELQIQSEVQLLGLQSYAQIANYMQAASAFILCSKQETQGCVAIESQCCGTPVIATNIGGLNEYVPTLNGVLINVLEPNTLYIAMENMMQNINNYDAATISKNSIEKYCYLNIGKQIDAVYKKAIGNV